MIRQLKVRVAFGVLLATFVSAAGMLLRAEPPQTVGTWASLGTTPESRVGAAAVALPDGRTLIAGGSIAGAPTDSVVVFDPADGSFASAGHLLLPRVGHTATLLDDGRVLIAGGTAGDLLSADLELFDPSSGNSVLGGAMAQPRTGHAAARLADGKVLIAGGTSTDGVLQTAEIYDPNTGSSTATTLPMLVARTGASATTLIDGRVLIAGGNDGTVDLASAELFEASSQIFEAATTSLSVPRSGHAAVLLPWNNSVLIAGGSSNHVTQTTSDLFLPAEFPDPYSYGMGSFAPTGSLIAPRSGAVASPHIEGYAVAIGGGAPEAEVYRFATIKTDKDDYAPGTKAIITGSGWEPNADVTLVFQEDPAVHDDYILHVTSKSDGTIYWDQWAPEEHDLNVRFYLLAKQSTTQGERRAQTTFTDAKVANNGVVVAAPTSVTVAAGNTATYGTVTVTLNGSNNSCTVTLGVGVGLPAGVTPVFGNSPFTSTGGNVTSSFSLNTLHTTPPGTYTFRVTATDGTGCQDTNTEPSTNLLTLVVIANPTISKAFGAPTIPLNGSTSLSFTISNPNASTSLTGVAFSDTLPAGLVVASPNGLSGTCGGGTITATAGSGSVSLSGATLAGGASCTFSVNVTGTTAGPKNNTTGNVTSTNGGTGNTASASVTVLAPPTISKAFGAATIVIGDSTSLSFSITNPNSATALTGVAFSDTLPAGLVVATPNGLSGTCGGGTITATAGTGSVSLSGATLAGSASCTFSVNVTGTTTGVKSNTTSTISSTNGGTGATSNTATLTVLAKPTLIVKKHVINDNGGIKTASDFSLTVTGTNVQPSATFVGSEAGTTVTLTAGTYSIDEAAVSGYTKTIGTDCSGSIANGETKTCTITNDDQAPHLIVIKHVINDNGGTKSASDFTMTITGVTTATPSAPGAESPGVDNTLTSVGGYSIDEGAHVGYDKTLSADCSGSIALGETKTCTITNDDQAPHLIVIKHVVNDNGGTKVASDFTTTITGVTTATPTTAGAESPGVDNTLTSVGGYTIDEGAHVGYDKTLSADCTGSIALGETKTCTITNDDIQPTLVVKKHVVNDNGGTKAPADWTMSVTGTSPSPASFPGVDAGTTVHLNAGAYSVTESGPAGYAQTITSADCSGTLVVGDTKTCEITNDDVAPHLIVIKHVVNDNGGTKSASDFTTTITGVTTATPTAAGAESPGVDNTLTSVGSYSIDEGAHVGYDKTLSADCSGSIALGETKTCTVTNDDQAPHLIVIKHVVNDNGGTKSASDFTTTITGVTTATPTAAGAESPGVDNTLTSVGSYSIDEGAHVGYDKTLSADCSGSIALGETKTCTVTNDDQAPHLIVIKHVVNDNGGTKSASDFTTTITGVTTATPTAAGAESPGVDNTLTSVGSYSIDEGAHVGYDKTFSADCSGSIALGETKTCTVTNDDQAPHLIVIKHVVNDNGGTKVASDFTTTITGVTTATPSAAGAESPGVNNTLTSVGSYSIDEGAHVGYDKTLSADCSGSIALGETKTCTVTNDDQAPHLIVIKHVVNDNGGTKVASDFTTTITGVTTATPSAAGAESPGVNNTLTSVGSYSIDEGAHVGYDKTLSADCSGSIALGETKTCTVTNDDQAPHLIVIKHVVNDNGGTKSASDFTTTITGVTTATPTAAGAESPGVDNTLTSVGSYSIDEGAHVGYDKTLSADCSGSIALDETKTCTITNNDIQPRLTVTKVVVNDNGGAKTVSDFPLFVDSGAVTSGVQNGFNAGAHTVSETGQTGYAATINGDCAANGSITLNPGDVKSCTITNDDIAPKLTVTKIVVNDNGGTKVIADFPLFVDGGAVTSGVQNTFNAGAHTVSETGQPFYAATISGDCPANGSITLNPGDVKSCIITNDDYYNFTGFFRPVDNLPIVNAAQAGSAIPVKFSLGGNQGLAIFAANYPGSFQTNCNNSDPIDAIAETVNAGGSSLSYDAGSGQYNYVWKTDKSWANTCRRLEVKLIDGTVHVADFKFKK